MEAWQEAFLFAAFNLCFAHPTLTLTSEAFSWKFGYPDRRILFAPPDGPRATNIAHPK